MQNYALTVDKFLDHAAKWSGDRDVVSGDAGASKSRIGYAAIRERSNRLSGALSSLGLRLGDRIATLAWNTQHHLEASYAAMGLGLVCHTLNPRLTAAQLASMIEEAEDRVLFAASNLRPLLAELLPLCPRLEHVILMDGGSLAAEAGLPAGATAWDFETLLSQRGATATWGAFAEETPAGLCYTSGTTGRPKGVLYTHRSNYLHTLRALQADAIGLKGSDTVLVAVPMFHANGWGLPFAAPAVGARMVLPGRSTDGASLASLIRNEGVTIAFGVQTVWLGLLNHLDTTGEHLPTLRRIMIGGSKCPDALIRRMEERLNARVQTSWGMTELSPVGTIATCDSPWTETRASGRPVMGVDLKLTDADGVTLPQQRGVVGHLKVKGHSVLGRYFKAEQDALDPEGYFDTGDLASIDLEGNLSICGRSKDLIKSGGEWINPADIEEIVGRFPAVGQVAVIGRADPKWGERPVLIVEARQGQTIDTTTILETLRGKIASWWMPDRLVRIPAMPLAATGKIDKLRLRADYSSGKLIDEELHR